MSRAAAQRILNILPQHLVCQLVCQAACLLPYQSICELELPHSQISLQGVDPWGQLTILSGKLHWIKTWVWLQWLQRTTIINYKTHVRQHASLLNEIQKQVTMYRKLAWDGFQLKSHKNRAATFGQINIVLARTQQREKEIFLTSLQFGLSPAV